MKVFLFIILLFVAPSKAVCQTVTNVIARAEGEQVQIVYDLAGNAGESYEVKLFCSRDGGKTFTEAPSKVVGAVNRWEAPGTAKAISWEAKKDLGDYEGNLQFKVVAMGKGSTTQPTKTTQVSAASTSNSASMAAENDDINFTIASIFTVTDGFKVFFKVKAKRDVEIGLGNNTQAEDQFGNIYAIYSADIENLPVLNGKLRKALSGSRKDGEMILKISKLNSGSLNGRILKKLVIETTVGTLQLSDIPRY